MKSFLFAAVSVLALSFSPAFAVTPTPYASLTAGSAFQDTSRDNQSALGGALGLDFGFLRGELAFDRLDMGKNGGGALGQVDSNIVSAKGYVQYPLGVLTPYVGGGLGYSLNNGSGSVRDGLVGIGALGVTLNLTKTLSVGAGYEYVRSLTDSVRDNTGSEQFSAHKLGLNVRVNF